MIFGNLYDKALWLLLKVDPENEKEIIKFIKEIPHELIDEIQKIAASININDLFSKKRVRIGYKNLYSYDGEINTTEGITYKYELDRDWLDIVKIEGSEEAFELTLCPLPKKMFTSQLCGVLDYGDIIENESKYIDYCLCKTPFGYFMKIEKDLEEDYGIKKSLKYVYPKKIPKDLNLENISSKLECKKLKKIKK